MKQASSSTLPHARSALHWWDSDARSDTLSVLLGVMRSLSPSAFPAWVVAEFCGLGCTGHRHGRCGDIGNWPRAQGLRLVAVSSASETVSLSIQTAASVVVVALVCLIGNEFSVGLGPARRRLDCTGIYAPHAHGGGCWIADAATNPRVRGGEPLWSAQVTPGNRSWSRCGPVPRRSWNRWRWLTTTRGTSPASERRWCCGHAGGPGGCGP